MGQALAPNRRWIDGKENWCHVKKIFLRWGHKKSESEFKYNSEIKVIILRKQQYSYLRWQNHCMLIMLGNDEYVDLSIDNSGEMYLWPVDSKHHTSNVERPILTDCGSLR